MRIARTNSELTDAIQVARSSGKRIALIPTMGAIHAGHLSLLRIGQAQSEFSVVSIFVNPKQFNSASDLATYPRTEAEDAQLLLDAGADLLFLPSEREIYPRGVQVPVISAGELGSRLEGASRPGHFDGVLTVVSRLLDLVLPDVAVFGEKDAQQLFLVQQMVENQNRKNYRPYAVSVIPGPTVREASGLALSSRNQRLTDAQRDQAIEINRVLTTAAEQLASGDSISDTLRWASSQLSTSMRVDYLQLVSAAEFSPVAAGFSGDAILLCAVELGTVRLIDNVRLLLPSETGQTRDTSSRSKGIQ